MSNNNTPEAAGNATENNEPYYGDLAKTQILASLFAVPRDKRDHSWQESFLSNVTEASFTCHDPQVIQGPDGFPYFVLNIPEAGKPFSCFVIKHLKNDLLLDKGIGVAVNLASGSPDWVFTYGDIVNYHLYNEFYSPAEGQDPGRSETITEDENVLVAQPSAQYLPSQTREILRQFLNRHGINDPKIALMARTIDNQTVQQLVFNLTPEKFQDQAKFESIMSCIAWFLPRHYSYVSMEDSSIGDGFTAM